MRKIIAALLSGAYLCLALTVATLLWRSGGGWGAALAGLIGTLGLAFALHGAIARAFDRAALSAEAAALREANLLLVAQMERMQASLDALGDGAEAARRSEDLAGEVRLLEGLVQQLSERLDEPVAAPAARPRSAAQAASLPLTSGVVEPLFPEPPRAAGRQPYAAALLGEIRGALADNRVDLYLQPVVSLPQRRTVYYESFSRLRDDSGRVMMPAEYLAVAEPEGLVSAIDNLLLFRCVQILRRLARQDRKVGIFCNISLASLADEAFFPQFLDFLDQNRDVAGGLIFELGQAAFEARGSVEARNMARMADLGFRFSLDKVSDLSLDFADLARSDVKFLKIGAGVLLDQLHAADAGAPSDIHAADFADLARRYGLEIIAEKIESEREVVDILELDVGYGQGHLFGEPRAIRDAVLAEADPPSEFIGAPLRRKSGGAAWRA